MTYQIRIIYDCTLKLLAYFVGMQRTYRKVQKPISSGFITNNLLQLSTGVCVYSTRLGGRDRNSRAQEFMESLSNTINSKHNKKKKNTTSKWLVIIFIFFQKNFKI